MRADTCGVPPRRPRYTAAVHQAGLHCWTMCVCAQRLVFRWSGGSLQASCLVAQPVTVQVAFARPAVATRSCVRNTPATPRHHTRLQARPPGMAAAEQLQARQAAILERLDQLDAALSFGSFLSPEEQLFVRQAMILERLERLAAGGGGLAAAPAAVRRCGCQWMYTVCGRRASRDTELLMRPHTSCLHLRTTQKAWWCFACCIMLHACRRLRCSLPPPHPRLPLPRPSRAPP